jgi:hypothetical protein
MQMTYIGHRKNSLDLSNDLCGLASLFVNESFDMHDRGTSTADQVLCIIATVFMHMTWSVVFKRNPFDLRD